jgi:hypothetical protein
LIKWPAILSLLLDVDLFFSYHSFPVIPALSSLLLALYFIFFFFSLFPLPLLYSISPATSVLQSSKNIRFDLDHRIQITDFYRIGLEVCESEKERDILSSERWSPHLDVRGFALILFEILFGYPMMLSGVWNDPITIPTNVPMFVVKLIEAGQSPGSQRQQTFNDIFNILKGNNFEVVSGVDSTDVLTFIDWVESFE